MTPEQLTTERGSDYGHPKKNFQIIADYFTIYLQERLKEGERIRPEDIPFFNIFTKVSREQHKHKKDNADDIEGYAHTIKMLHDED